MNRTKPGMCSPADHQLARRAFLGTAAGAVGGLVGLDFLGSPVLADQIARGQKRVIMLFLSGGASQFETWDPKPGRATGGPFQTIQTSIPGVRISELMPLMAGRLHRHTAIIRSLSTMSDHGDRIMLGERTDTANVSMPSFGCMLTKELAPATSQIPDHVALYAGREAYSRHQDTPAFLGARYDAMRIVNGLTVDANRLPPGMSDRDHRDRSELRERLSRGLSAGRERDATLMSHGMAYERVRGVMANDRLFDISREPQQVRDRYGHSLFGQQTLVARRLAEAGVPFVRVVRGWWDTHGENFEIHARLAPDFDQVMSALLDDLEQRGMIEDTLVVTFAEMGRTPAINNRRGRDHWGKCWSITLSGCGIRPGVVHGATNADGTDIARDRVTTQQFFATIFQAVGIDHQKEYLTPDGRPVRLTTYNTVPIADVLA